MNPINLEFLERQLATLKEDQRKTNEKMFQIMGAMKLVEYLIEQSKEPEAINNGA